MPVLASAAPAITAIATVAATGISIYSAQQQASSQRAIAQQNYQLQQRAAEDQRRQTLRSLELQTSQLALQQSQRSIESNAVDLQEILLDKKRRTMEETYEIQQEQLTMQKAILEKNRETALVNAEQTAREAMERTRRIKSQEEETIARQRAVYAGAGVLIEGTPLAVLGDTAATYSLIAQDEIYQSDLERRQHLLTAESIGLDIEGIGLESDLMDLEFNLGLDNIELEKANLDISRSGYAIENQQLELQKSLLELDSYSTQSQFRNRMRQASIDRYATNQSATGTEISGYGQAIGGIASSASAIGNVFNNPSTTTPDWRYNATSTLIS